MEAFKSRGAQAITVTSRTFDWCPLSRRKPDELAEKFGGICLSFSKYQESLHHFDVILTSTASGRSLISETEVRKLAMKAQTRQTSLFDRCFRSP